MEYQEAWDLQRTLAEARTEGRVGDTLLLLEHPPVYTMGRSSRRSDMLLPVEYLEARGARVVEVDRGGQITFHGPGQLVGYPIVDVKAWGGGPLRYVRALEALLIRALGDFGIEASYVGKPTGVWAGDVKIAAIGVRISRGVTTHGFALNVSTDLAWFQNIVPCGIHHLGVASMEQLLGRSVSLQEVVPAVVDSFGHEMGFQMKGVSPEAVVGHGLQKPTA